jgi:hypothetical protein
MQVTIEVPEEHVAYFTKYGFVHDHWAGKALTEAVRDGVRRQAREERRQAADARREREFNAAFDRYVEEAGR